MKSPTEKHGAAPEVEEFDTELNLKAIVWTGIATLGITAISMVLMWWLFRGFEKLEDREDTKPPAMAEAAAPTLPPEPRLEESPPANLAALRAREQEVLDSPAWVDEASGIVRIPLDLAIDVIARKGLGGAPAVAVPEAPVPAQDAPATPTPPTPTPPSAAAGSGR